MEQDELDSEMIMRRVFSLSDRIRMTSIPDRHRLLTNACPSVSRMMQAVSTESWTEDERKHIKDCVYCTKFVPIAEREIKEAKRRCS